MKTCKDCIFHSKVKLRKNVLDDESYYSECHFYPTAIVTFSGYWCGQLKTESITRETFDKIWDEAHKDDDSKYQVYVDSEGVSRYRKIKQ